MESSHNRMVVRPFAVCQDFRFTVDGVRVCSTRFSRRPFQQLLLLDVGTRLGSLFSLAHIMNKEY